MPSINFNRSSENDLVWNSSTNSYTSPKPEHLYGWTDNELTDTTYYAWYNPSSDSVANRRIFSLYENPKINDTVLVFSYNANRTSYDISEATETTIISTVPGTGAVNSVALNSNGTLYLQTSTMGGITCERASSWDMTVANPLKTIYTDSTTLTNGMSVTTIHLILLIHQL